MIQEVQSASSDLFSYIAELRATTLDKRSKGSPESAVRMHRKMGPLSLSPTWV